MINAPQAFSIILVCGIVTALLRTLPFIIWNGNKKVPEYILWLGHVLPYAIMMMLIVFALRGISFETGAIVGFGSASGGGNADYESSSAFLTELHSILYRFSGWLPSMIGVGVTAGVYAWRRNTLAAIILGTACYMMMVQFI